MQDMWWNWRHPRPTSTWVVFMTTPNPQQDKSKHIIVEFGGLPGSAIPKRVWCINHGRRCFKKLGASV